MGSPQTVANDTVSLRNSMLSKLREMRSQGELPVDWKLNPGGSNLIDERIKDAYVVGDYNPDTKRYYLHVFSFWTDLNNKIGQTKSYENDKDFLSALTNLAKELISQQATHVESAMMSLLNGAGFKDLETFRKACIEQGLWPVTAVDKLYREQGSGLQPDQQEVYYRAAGEIKKDCIKTQEVAKILRAMKKSPEGK